MRLRLALCLSLLALPVAAQDTATDCDRLAGYDHTPRREGLPGVYRIADPAAAIAACEAALAAPGADPFLNFLLARALLVADPQDPRAVTLAEAGRPASATFADSRLGLWHENRLAGLTADSVRGLELATAACAAWPDRMARAGCNNMARAQIVGDDAAARRSGFVWMDRLCDDGLGVACLNMGNYLHDGEVADVDLPRALGYFDRGCALGDGDACGWAGYVREHGEGTEVDLAAAYTLYVRSCDLGDPWGCYAQGDNLSKGLGVTRDWAAGMALLARACAMGEDEGCYEHAVGAMDGLDQTGPASPEALAAALAYFDASCAAGSARSCTEMGFAHQNGRGVAQDTDAAFRFHERACEGGDALGCNNLGVHHGLGLGVPVTMDLAIAYYRRACDAGVGIGCANLAEVTEASDPEGAAAAQVRACTLGYTAACGDR